MEFVWDFVQRNIPTHPTPTQGPPGVPPRSIRNLARDFIFSGFWGFAVYAPVDRREG
jgi:hypothetical protein